MRLLTLSLLLSPAWVFASNSDAYGGFGLTAGQSNFSVSSPQSANSKFSTLGYFLEGGITVGNKWGLLAGAELGQSQSNNTLSSRNYLESATNSHYGAKVGLFFNGQASLGYGFGGGYRLSNWNVKSSSVDRNSYEEITYKGTDTLIYANLNMEMNKRYRTTIELQSVSGTLKSSDSSISDIKYTELLLSLRFFVIFN